VSFYGATPTEEDTINALYASELKACLANPTIMGSKEFAKSTAVKPEKGKTAGTAESEEEADLYAGVPSESDSD
jgi:hypothetical protein